MKITLLIVLIHLSFITAQGDFYCSGDVISSYHQNVLFNVCYPEDSSMNLAQYNGDINGGDYNILLIDLSATWCAPCYNSIPFWESEEQFWSENYPSVKFITALSDLNQPFSCQQWGNVGQPNLPIIIEGMSSISGESMYSWFNQPSFNSYPQYILIDHNMKVRGKTSGFINNSNDPCNGNVDNLTDWNGGSIQEFIYQLVDECGQDCNSNMLGCTDVDACNYDPLADNSDNNSCFFAEQNFDCEGNCIAIGDNLDENGLDCNGICGGTADIDANGYCTDNVSCCTNLSILSDQYYPTIQSAIDEAATGDTIIVEQGKYCENLKIEKEIVLASRAIFDDLNCATCFVDYQYEWIVTNSNINNTIIDGSCLTMGDDLGSVIVIDSPFTSCIQPEIFGFTIQGGIGTKIVKEMYDDDCPSGQDTCTYERIAGGGIIVNDSWSRNVIPSIHYNKIIDNGSADCISERSECNEFGGGLALASGTDIDFPSRNVSNKLIGNNIDRDCNDLAQNISNNVYKNNFATNAGSSISVMASEFAFLQFSGNLNMKDSRFDVYDCSDNTVSAAWVDLGGLDVDPVFDGGAGDQCAITNDVWVSPDGDDFINYGNSPNSPFRTIKHALEIIDPSEDNPITIYLDEGYYSPSSTGETFPVYLWSSWINLVGKGEELSILDAQGSSNVIRIFNYDYSYNNTASGNLIKDISVTGGSIDNYNSNGAGIANELGFMKLENLLIYNNNAGSGYGGGIYSNNCFSLDNVKIFNNLAFSGGGIMALNTFCDDGDFNKIAIINNKADFSGNGIVYSNVAGGEVFINQATIYGNKGSGVLNAPIFLDGPIHLEIINSIVSDDKDWFFHINGDSPSVSFSNIYIENSEEVYPGENNINLDPLFMDIENYNFSLIHSNDLISPCIDEGTSDINGDGLSNDIPYWGNAPDMGAFEYTCDTNIYDDCGICNGDNSFCTDCNGILNGGAELDCLGVCGGTAELDECSVCNGDSSSCTDCNGVVNGDAELDCLGVCGGNAELDECGICEGNGNSCNCTTSACLYMDNMEIDTITNTGTIDIFYTSVVELQGIQIAICKDSHQDSSNTCNNEDFFNITDVYGGVVSESDWFIQNNNYEIVAFNIAGSLVQSDNYVHLITFEFDIITSEICIPFWYNGTGDANPIFSDSSSEYIDISVPTECVIIIPGCTDMNACNYDLSATVNDGSCVYPDDCGECDGDGSTCSCESNNGDLNGDEVISIFDLVQMSYYILELFTPDYECAADYNQDGSVDILDLVEIINFILFDD